MYVPLCPKPLSYLQCIVCSALPSLAKNVPELLSPLSLLFSFTSLQLQLPFSDKLQGAMNSRAAGLT